METFVLYLVQHKILKAFETGIKDKGLAPNLCSMLHTHNASHEDLMHYVNNVASVQAERKSKALFPLTQIYANTKKNLSNSALHFH